jgi:formiminotetrahydrofolate cyclodeaminase
MNLVSLTDELFVARMKQRIEQLLAQADVSAAQSLDDVARRGGLA